MKRELKFRAWDDEMECMVLSIADSEDNDHYWCFDDGEIKAYGLKDVPASNYNPPDQEPYPLSELMQFTGLTDKNGKEIYEGDIVRWDDCSNGKYWRVCKVIWNKSRYELHGYTFDTDTPDDKRKVDFTFGQFGYEQDGWLEIIGNVFENPEILNP